MMRIGLAIASDRIRAVGVHAGRVLWALEGERSLANALSADITQLLRRAALPRWPRPVVFAAIGPSASQTKRLSGLPNVTDAAALRAIVRESTSRFFLRNGIPLITSGVRVDGAESVWAAAFDLPSVREVESACRALRLRVRMIAPSLVALPRAIGNGRIEWIDGAVRSELIIADHRLAGTRRLPEMPAGGSVGAFEVVAALKPLGAESWKFADAYGATQLADDESLALRSSSGDLDASATRREVKIAATALGVAVVAVIGSTIVGIALRDHRIARNLASIERQAHVAELAEVDLGRMSAALTQVSAFDASRRSPTTLLAQLARALPEGSILANVRIDTAGGMVALLAPRASAALAALDSVRAVSAPEIIGPVTKEVVGARELERATMQFRLAPPSRGAP